jgi:hypothetical protein
LWEEEGQGFNMTFSGKKEGRSFNMTSCGKKEEQGFNMTPCGKKEGRGFNPAESRLASSGVLTPEASTLSFSTSS